MVGKEVEIISVLGSSQGVISVVAALLAGASGTMLTCVSEEAMLRAGFISYLFLLSGTLGTALNLGTAVICIVAEQESKVAYAFSILYGEIWAECCSVLKLSNDMCVNYSLQNRKNTIKTWRSGGGISPCCEHGPSCASCTRCRSPSSPWRVSATLLTRALWGLLVSSCLTQSGGLCSTISSK